MPALDTAKLSGSGSNLLNIPFTSLTYF